MSPGDYDRDFRCAVISSSRARIACSTSSDFGISRVSLLGRACAIGCRSQIRSFQLFSSSQNFRSQLIRIDDTHQLHVCGPVGTLASRFESQDAEVKVLEQRAFDKGDVLDVLQRNSFFYLKDNPLAKTQRCPVHDTLKAVEIVSRPPLANSAEPHDGQWEQDQSGHHDKADVHNEIRRISGLKLAR